MRDLRPSDEGRNFTGVIGGIRIVSGKVKHNSGRYYLCQNEKDGDNCGPDKFGYSFSWNVGNGTVSDMESAGAIDINVLFATKEEIEKCNDFFPGHILVNPKKDLKISIEGKMGEVLLAKYIKGINTWAQVYTSQELYDKGWRIEAEPEELPSVEMSVAEVATKLGLDPKTLKIVDK